MAGALSRSRAAGADYTWPGYVDALTTLLMVLIFMLSIFSVAQFTLSSALTGKDTAIDALGKQISTLVEQLSLEKQSSSKLQKDLQALALQLGQLRAERDSLNTERDQLSVSVKSA